MLMFFFRYLKIVFYRRYVSLLATLYFMFAYQNVVLSNLYLRKTQCHAYLNVYLKYPWISRSFSYLYIS